MSKVSVIIPARGEKYLARTAQDVLANATGDVEVIAVLDGYWPDPPLSEDPRLHVIHRSVQQGMRSSINAGAAIAKGKYVMKLDAHCAVAPGFDEVLQADCDGDWVVVPRRKRLDPEAWQTTSEKLPVDYQYLHPPLASGHQGWYFRGVVWTERSLARVDIPIDDNMIFQGSTWFTTAEHFRKRIGGMSSIGYGTLVQEASEIALKTWLGGGRVIVNKSTWYAHWHKRTEDGRGYYHAEAEALAGHRYAAWFWMTNQWAERTRDFEWLIDYFWPVPFWPENWKVMDWSHLQDRYEQGSQNS